MNAIKEINTKSHLKQVSNQDKYKKYNKIKNNFKLQSLRYYWKHICVLSIQINSLHWIKIFVLEFSS